MPWLLLVVVGEGRDDRSGHAGHVNTGQQTYSSASQSFRAQRRALSEMHCVFQSSTISSKPCSRTAAPRREELPK